MENVVILGTGIAGLTAAVYAARADLSPLVIAGPEPGGQLTLTTEVENFPGFEHGVQGPELVEVTKKQAARFGARYNTALCKDVEKKDDHLLLTLDNGNTIQTKTLIVATGASARWLGLESEKKYKGRGVTTCATCDGFFYKGKEVVVIGGGDSAMEEATFLTKFCTKVTVIHRRDTFRASKIMVDKAKNNDKIEFIYDSTIEEILGDDKKVTGVKIKNVKTGELAEVPCDGVFLAIGHIPNTTFLKGKVDLDEKGYLKTNERRETSMPGVFGAGDVQDTRYRQAITAAGTGCAAALEAEWYIEHH